MWVVDTCVVLDVFEHDPRFGLPSARLLERLLPDGLAVSPVTMVELSAAFSGDLVEQMRFLDHAGIAYSDPWTSADMEASHRAWHACVRARRTEKVPRRPVANLLIGGFAFNRSGLVTRDPGDFKRWYPKLTIREP
ncbi:MAG: type II toxin-antitoxin system VapC family toxin [Opitutaceae bacterium]|nr:type II toxin-antitoxin system VapC family toxin [Opitutaceae bacterium]